MELKNRLNQVKDKLDNLDQEQAQVLHEYEELMQEFEASNLVQKNEQLKEELAQLKKSLAELEEEQRQIQKENYKLKSALQEQILNEKMNILKTSRDKLDTYFGSEKYKYNNQLLALKKEAKQQLEQVKSEIDQELATEKEEFKRKFSNLYAEFKEKVTAQQKQLSEKETTIKETVHDDLDELKNEDLNQETIEKRVKQNQLEMTIGLNWVNKIGVLLILFGVIAGFKYSYSHWFNDYIKGIIFFLLGGGFIAGGDWFYRQQKDVFAKGLLGGGIAILYASTFYSYFLLEIMNLVVAFGVMLLITFATIISALRYNSRTICSLGLFGGYLTFITYINYYHDFQFGLYVAVAYLLILTLSVLLLSFKKRWIILNYISFFTNLPALIFLVFTIQNEFLAISYALVTFIIYLTIVLAYPFKYKITLKVFDVILLAINTVVNGALLYSLLFKANLDMYTGLVALFFAVVYLALGQFVQKNMATEKHTIFLFYGTALTFAILMIPFQFGIEWLTIGWLIEGLVLAGYGHKNQLKKLELSGLGIFALCLIVFLFIDLPAALSGNTNYFDIKYFSVMASQLSLLVLYLNELKKGKLSVYSKQGVIFFKYFVVFNLWTYLLYNGLKIYSHLIPQTARYYTFYRLLIIALVSMGFGSLITQIKIICDEIINIFKRFLYILGDLICLRITLTIPVFLQPASKTIRILSLLILLAYNVLVFFNLKDLLIELFKKKRYSFEWFPVVMSSYLLGLITTFLIIQLNLGNYNLLFSVVYLILAIAFIIYGFKEKFMYQRRLGLGLSLFATGKLFLYDLSFLGAGGKIVAYFIFGLILILISFIYQKMKEFTEDYYA